MPKTYDNNVIAWVSKDEAELLNWLRTLKENPEARVPAITKGYRHMADRLAGLTDE